MFVVSTLSSCSVVRGVASSGATLQPTESLVRKKIPRNITKALWTGKPIVTRAQEQGLR